MKRLLIILIKKLQRIVLISEYIKGAFSLSNSNSVTFSGDGFITTRKYGGFDSDFERRFEQALTYKIPESLHRYSHIKWRAHFYETFALNSLGLEGELVELGVWYGFLANLVCNNDTFRTSKKNFHLVDAFGFSETEAHYIGRKSKKFREDIFETVQDRFQNLNVVFHRGFIPEILASREDFLPEKICFLSMDLNNLKTEQAGLEFLWDRVVRGGYVYIDDYSGNDYEETRNFYDEFALNNNCRILKTPFSAAIMQKV